MSNVVNRMRLSGLSRASVVIGTVVVILGIIAAFVGYQLYQKLTTNTVVAYFSNALALYPGDRVQIMGVQVGNIDKIEPAGDKTRLRFSYVIGPGDIAQAHAADEYVALDDLDWAVGLFRALVRTA